MSELKPCPFKKWLFVPNFSGNITVTDLFNGQRRERQLRPSDFQYEDGKVPNYGMLTYVGISEISKEIESLQAKLNEAKEALMWNHPEGTPAESARLKALSKIRGER